MQKSQTAIKIQIFGLKNSPASRAAERFFKERGIAIHYVDLRSKPIAPGELKRFVQRFGWERLLDPESKPYVDAGLKYLKLSELELLARIERSAWAPMNPRGGKCSHFPCKFSKNVLNLRRRS